jgi:stage V sporulation protein G
MLFKTKNQVVFMMNIKQKSKRHSRTTVVESSCKSKNFDEGFIIKTCGWKMGAKGLFVSMPSGKIKDGSYVEICHPLKSMYESR